AERDRVGVGHAGVRTVATGVRVRGARAGVGGAPTGSAGGRRAGAAARRAETERPYERGEEHRAEERFDRGPFHGLLREAAVGLGRLTRRVALSGASPRRRTPEQGNRIPAPKLVTARLGWPPGSLPA